MALDIDILIEHYQSEVKRIGQLIEDHKADHNYEALLLDDKALQYVHNELTKLLALKNPNYYDIQSENMLIEGIKRMNKVFVEKYGDAYSNYLDDDHSKIKVRKTKIHELEKGASRHADETQILDDALYDLLEKKLTRLNLSIPIYQSNLYLHITSKDSQILKLALFSSGDENLYLHSISVVKELGFYHNKEKRQCHQEYRLASHKNILPFKEFLARLVFGLKSSFQFKSTMYLERVL